MDHSGKLDKAVHAPSPLQVRCCGHQQRQLQQGLLGIPARAGGLPTRSIKMAMRGGASRWIATRPHQEERRLGKARRHQRPHAKPRRQQPAHDSVRTACSCFTASDSTDTGRLGLLVAAAARTTCWTPAATTRQSPRPLTGCCTRGRLRRTLALPAAPWPPTPAASRTPNNRASRSVRPLARGAGRLPGRSLRATSASRTSNG